MSQSFAAGSAVRTCTVLVVDDEPALSRLLSRILDGNGCAVMEAHDPEAALKLAENFQAGIDLLISDVVMPGMTGSELSERLRQTYPQMQTIYISAYDRREAVVAKASAGAVFLQKPFTPAQLKQAVAHVLNTHGDFANLTATSPSPGEWTC